MVPNKHTSGIYIPSSLLGGLQQTPYSELEIQTPAVGLQQPLLVRLDMLQKLAWLDED